MIVASEQNSVYKFLDYQSEWIAGLLQFGFTQCSINILLLINLFPTTMLAGADLLCCFKKKKKKFILIVILFVSLYL